MEKVTELFLEYAAMDTQSDDSSDTFPSTDKQIVLARLLASSMTAMGLSEVVLDETFGYVYATINATITNPEQACVLGFIAHMDTSPEVSGNHVTPRIVKEYDGHDIVLNAEKNILLKTADFPEILQYQGQDLIVTDGTTLLGADDKAGIAEIMAMAEYLITHPEIPHGKIRIAFTPDEEIGQGSDHFDLEGFGADFAYTVDGGGLGELEYENFNAANATLCVTGRSVHPGSAKNKMVNAILLAQEFQAMLPANQSPMNTEHYEGFYHVEEFTGSVERTDVSYLIRDHDRTLFEAKKDHFQRCADFLNMKYNAPFFSVSIRDSYYNMKELIEPHMHLIEHAKKAMEELHIEPIITPVRGGTDGARLSFQGLPCPNLCTGGHNFHGRYEYIPIQSMEKIVLLLIEIAKSYASFYAADGL